MDEKTFKKECLKNVRIR